MNDKEREILLNMLDGLVRLRRKYPPLMKPSLPWQ